jgi:hypothetical protein
MPTKIALENSAICGAIEDRAHASVRVRSGPRALGHAPVVDMLAAARIVGNAPAVVAIIDIRQRRERAPSAITVCALPSGDLQIMPTETPAADASMAARPARLQRR